MFKVDHEEGLTLTELADGVEIKDITNSTACSFKVIKNHTQKSIKKLIN